MAVEDGVVAWVGDEDQGDAYASGADEVVALEGALVTPAFVDAHVHATSTGIALTGLDLTGVRSLRECLDAVERHARAARGDALLGVGWDETTWPEHRPPTRQELDRASYGSAVYLSRVDVHSAVVSSALLAAAPEVRTAVGYSDSGHLTTDAHHLVRRLAHESVGPARRLAAQRATRAEAARLGIGCLHEMAGPGISSPEDLTGLVRLAAEEPGPQVVAYWGELGALDQARELGALGAAGDLFADGALGSRTASLTTAYADADHAGHGYLTATQVRDHVIACTGAGLQAGFHAIGDAAMAEVTRGLVEAAAAVGVDAVRAGRPRLEHVEMAEPWMMAELARLGVVASVQPAFDRLWGGETGMYAERLGVERALRLNHFASMTRAGMTLALGSDTPVTPLDPWGTVRAAVRHHVAGERLDRAAAFEAHTVGGWRAAGRDDLGRLAVGEPATYAVWSVEGDLVDGLPRLDDADPLPVCRQTVVAGRAVYTA
jgi:predicted amidohydrolase YtcJ